MRVAFVTNLCPHYRRPLFEELSRRLDVSFFFTSSGSEWYWHGLHRLESDGLPAARLGRSRDLVPAILRGGYDCVVASLTGRVTLPATVLSARARGLPLVLWVGIWAHPRTLFHRLSRPLTERLLRSADALVVYGSHVAAHVERASGRRDGVFIAPQAVDNAAFRTPVTDEELAALRRELALRDAPVAAFVGRLETEKGLENLLRASAAAETPHTLLLIGSGSREQELRRLAGQLGLGDRVCFAGYVDQTRLPAYLRLSDFLVLPSVSTRRFREPWGLVVNEAMNCGLPVVATDAVGAAAGGLVVDAETGLVVPEREVEPLGQALDRLAADTALRARLGAVAAERVLGWNYEAQASAFEEAIDAALRQTRRTACAS